ncbi:MAG: hypothetical protein LUC96_12165 [Alistipes sp.]|uniref:hypothetical protein n=1 Tax=Alistipes sp. TaxID=1872444 RepID=UPI0025BC1006|nr:hypothetical protein [Alistipes sp.]MCD8275711.1 hypothetical protein [Alistipes sp.]
MAVLADKSGKFPPPVIWFGKIFALHLHPLLDCWFMEEQIPLGFIGILLGVFACAFLIGVGVIYLKQRRVQRLKNPRKDYYR